MISEAFLKVLEGAAEAAGTRLYAAERKAVLSALAEPDPEAVACHATAMADPEPDSEMRDTETVPLREDVDDYMEREVLPHVTDAWVDERKTKIGYEIPFNRHFYVYEPPRPLEARSGPTCKSLSAKSPRCSQRSRGEPIAYRPLPRFGRGVARPCAGALGCTCVPAYWCVR